MAILQTTGVTGSLSISSSGIPSSTSASLFSVNGYNGRLLDVVDNLSGSLFSVNTIAGLPVLDVWSDNRIFMGKYNANDLVISGSRVGIGTDVPLSKLHVVGSEVSITNGHQQDEGIFLIPENSSDANGIQRGSALSITKTLRNYGTSGYHLFSGLGTNWSGNGRLGAVRFYGKALSASEVLQNYNATKSRFGL